MSGKCPKCGANKMMNRLAYLHIGEWECESYRLKDGGVEQSGRCKLAVAERHAKECERAMLD